MTQRFSIIIPDTDSTRIDQIIDALERQSAGLQDGEAIVVGSDRPGLVHPSSRVRFISTGEEHSFASDKRNIGLQAAQGEIFLFLDDDCLPRQDWLKHHLQRHQQGELVVGGAVEFGHQSYVQLADNLSAFHDLLPYTAAGPRSYLAAANLSVHRTVVEKAGPMEAHQNRADDLEWTVRFRQSGFRLYFEPRAVVWHDPDRCTLASVWKHWVDDAPNTLRVRLRYAEMLDTPRLAWQRAVYLWGSPGVAAWATLRTFAHPRSLLRYGHTLPLVYLTKLAWCWSAYKHFPNLVQLALEK